MTLYYVPKWTSVIDTDNPRHIGFKPRGGDLEISQHLVNRKSEMVVQKNGMVVMNDNVPNWLSAYLKGDDRE